MVENSSPPPLSRRLPLVKVKMTPRGPHVVAGDDEPPDDGREESFARAVSTQLERDILPMSTGVPILPMQSAQITYPPITARPQTRIYKIGRFLISNAGTAWGLADWIVNDIKIGAVSQLNGDAPGDMFGHNMIESFVRFAPMQIAKDAVVVVVTYIGHNASGCAFFGAMVGTVIDTEGAKSISALEMPEHVAPSVDTPLASTNE